MLALDDNERRDRLASRIDALDHRCLLAIARLLRLCPTMLFGARNNYCY
jgi:hypothetical protein